MVSVSPKSELFYKTTAYIQNHTLLNRGITTIGGSTVPQCVMSNNKDETRERAIMGGIYFVASYLTPIILLPFYNKHFLAKNGVIKKGDKYGQKIIEISKKYLTKQGDLQKGVGVLKENVLKEKNGLEKIEKLDEILKNHPNKEDLKTKLQKVDEKVLKLDFLTTAWMWSLIPWIATETTEKKTNRKDFSGGFELKKEVKSKPENKQKRDKVLKFLGTAFFATIPALIFPKIVTKGLNYTSPNKISKNPIKKVSNSVLKFINKNPEAFNYTSGTNMSKTIYASIWLLSSYPAKIISSRDNNERRDRAIRDLGLMTMFFGGDFLINNLLGRLCDKALGTKIMTPPNSQKKGKFAQELSRRPINFKNLDKLNNLSPQMLKKTKLAGSIIYWGALFANMGLIGFALPQLLNKILKTNIEKENNNSQKIENNLLKYQLLDTM